MVHFNVPGMDDAGEKSMNIIRMSGGLGNQMFQYATLRSFQQKYFPNKKINLSFEKVEKKYVLSR